MQGSWRNAPKWRPELANWQTKRLLGACFCLKKPIIPKARKRPCVPCAQAQANAGWGLMEPALPEGARQEKGA